MNNAGEKAIATIIEKMAIQLLDTARHQACLKDMSEAGKYFDANMKLPQPMQTPGSHSK